VQTNLHWFEGTQLIVISNTLWVGEQVRRGAQHKGVLTPMAVHHKGHAPQVPCLTYGMRGMISASIEVKGPERDLHSGNEGGAAASTKECPTLPPAVLGVACLRERARAAAQACSTSRSAT